MKINKVFSGINVLVDEDDLDKKGVIYLLEFPNDKVYIGQTTQSLRHRISQHCSIGNECTKLRRALSKYKKVTVYALSSCLSIDQLNVFEAFFIKAYNSIQEGYNLTTGGLNYKRSKETCDKIAASKTGVKVHCDESKKKISQAVKNREIQQSTKQKLSDTGKEMVKSIPDNIIFHSIADCAACYGIEKTTMNRYYDGKIHKKSGQTFIKVGGKHD